VASEFRRVGIFGGTFDPPHVAHVVVGAAAIHQLHLDELLVIPAGVPWQKVGSRSISAGRHRIRMCEAAFDPVAAAVVSDIEVGRAGNSYTIDTLQTLSNPQTELFLLLGGDTAAGLDTWEQPGELATLATIAVFERRGFEHATPPSSFDWSELSLPGLEVSSSDIRRRVAAGEPITGLVPPLVEDVVRAEQLFERA